jgi:transcriptional regulator with PAS, ATPase and Fis domain
LFGRSNHSSSGGAEIRRIGPGKLEMANKGVLLVEEITEMPPNLQGKLLQVIQGRELVRPGESRAIPADVRVFATSSANLDRALAEKRLREDLYYRLSAYTVHVRCTNWRITTDFLLEGLRPMCCRPLQTSPGPEI